MIATEIESYLLENRAHFLIPAEVVATVQTDNALEHAFILLTKVKYSSIPVLDKHFKFKGLLTMPMITETMMGLEQLSFEQLRHLKVKDVMQKKVVTIEDPYDLENIMHLMVDHPYLPVVASNGDFTGIVTRREMMKSLNHLAHTFGK